MHGPNSPIHFARLAGVRVAATATALDAYQPEPAMVALRFAPDELFLTPPPTDPELIITPIISHDEHAIIIDDGSFSGAWVDEETALDLLQRHCEWELPAERPASVQGAVAGIATKLWFAEGKVLFVVQTPYAQEMEERLA